MEAILSRVEDWVCAISICEDNRSADTAPIGYGERQSKRVSSRARTCTRFTSAELRITTH